MEYTLKDVREVFPLLSPRSLQIWCQRGVILPAQPARGQGSHVGFDYQNLIEIGLVFQLAAFGFNSHSFLRQIMQEKRARTRRSWVELKYECIFLIENSAFTPEDKDHSAFDWSVQPYPFNFNSPGNPGYIVIDIGTIKRYVDNRLKSR